MSTTFAIVLMDKRKEGKGTRHSAYMKLIPSNTADAMDSGVGLTGKNPRGTSQGLETLPHSTHSMMVADARRCQNSSHLQR